MPSRQSGKSIHELSMLAYMDRLIDAVGNDLYPYQKNFPKMAFDEFSYCEFAYSDPYYCEECVFLSPKEHEHVNKKERHYCSKYRKRIYHKHAHPNLFRLKECMRDNSKQLKEGV
jgi:hypothetical protein